MEKELHDGIVALVEFAKRNDKVFVFGAEVYTPEEALDAMLSTAEEEIEMKEITVEEYLDEYRGLIFDKVTE